MPLKYNFVRLLIFALLIVFTHSALQAAVCDTIDISSQKMERSYRAIVVVPDSDQPQNWPVVYLLHGWSGSYRNWYDATDLELLD